jgi:pimeloyl-ACP methyl ester carboxylesterase
VQQATLVGHSMGSLIALEAAGRAPERVTRLVMMGTAYPMKVAEALLATALADPLRAIDMVNALVDASRPIMWVQALVPGPRHVAARQQPRADAPHAGRLAAALKATGARRAPCRPNLFHHEFSICDRYRGGEPARTARGQH